MQATLSSKAMVASQFKAAAPAARPAARMVVRAAAIVGEVPDRNKRNIMVMSQASNWHRPPVADGLTGAHTLAHCL